MRAAARLRQLARRLALLARRAGVERAMDEELRAHLEAETADLERQGLTPAEARRRALAAFGSIEAIKEDARDARGGRPMEDFVSDLRYGWRVLRRAPWLTTLAVLTFALGTGASAAVFSVVYGVLLRPLPYRDPGQLVALWERNIPRNRDRNVISADSFLAWRDRTRSFQSMAAMVPAHVTITAGGPPERVTGADVSASFFGVLGVAPALGRDLAEADAPDGSAIVLSHGFWQRRFGGDPAIVGRTIPVDGRPVTVAGVMPAGFDPPAFGWMGGEAFWRAMALIDANRAWGRYLHVVARLRPDASLAAARTDLESVAAGLAAERPTAEGWSASIVPLAEQISGDARPTLVALLIGVTLMLAMAVTNVATLTMAAMRRRTMELAVRRAVGATDTRIFRQLFVQSALVGLLGIAAGLLLAVPATHALTGLLPASMPRAASVALDLPVVAIVAGVNLAATLLFGTIAARRGRRAAQTPLVGRDAGDARTTANRGGGVLVTTEIAFGLAISVMALLMVQSFVSLRRVDVGFDPDDVLAVRIAAPPGRATSDDARRAFFDGILARVRALGGVASAGIVSARPFYGIGPATSIRDARQPAPPPDAAATVTDVRFVDAQALDALGIPLVEGRPFDRLADAAGPPRVIVSRQLVRDIWPDGGALGRHLAMTLFDGITPEVIGVVDDVHLGSVRTRPRPVAWLSAARFPDGERDLVIRTTVPPASLVPAVRAAVNEVEPGLPVDRATTMASLLDESLAADRFTTFLLSAFACVAIALAGIGVFGVFSADVVRRRKEIGLRLALGGSSGSVVGMLLRHAARRAAAGVAAGVILAWLLGGQMRALLYGIEPADPLTFAVVAAALALLAAVATLVPAMQALRAHPLRALREG